MMVGNNHLIINHATMMKIVQEWLNRNMVSNQSPTVWQIKYDGGESMFVVSLKSPEVRT